MRWVMHNIRLPAGCCTSSSTPGRLGCGVGGWEQQTSHIQRLTRYLQHHLILHHTWLMRFATHFVYKGPVRPVTVANYTFCTHWCAQQLCNMCSAVLNCEAKKQNNHTCYWNFETMEFVLAHNMLEYLCPDNKTKPGLLPLPTSGYWVFAISILNHKMGVSQCPDSGKRH